MTHISKRGQGLAVAAVMAVVVAFCLPASADAFESYYYCSLKPSGQWCDGRANGTYDGLNSWDVQEAWYPGTWDNTVTACERIYKPSTGSVLGGSCSLNYVSYYYGEISCTCWEANAKQISGGPHTIWGHAIN
jgi:hypothetical protein